ncbi:MAG TPA: Fur family transcriptional regulator [Candidatus Saccharimonadales bacterium]|nr:Fur family transcriptional regulator [Candidatus Saccharimonadales bacterium]
MSPEIKRFKALLKQNGHFVTKPRLRLFVILQKHNALTIHQLIKLLTLHDQATVYRNIKVFERLGIISRLQLGWHSKLELSDIFQHHHHHLTCTNCGRVIALPENPTVERALTQLARSKNFKAMDHQLEIRGLCQTCQSAA